MFKSDIVLEALDHRFYKCCIHNKKKKNQHRMRVSPIPLALTPHHGLLKNLKAKWGNSPMLHTSTHPLLGGDRSHWPVASSLTLVSEISITDIRRGGPWLTGGLSKHPSVLCEENSINLFLAVTPPQKRQSQVLAVPSPHQSTSALSLDSNQRLQLASGAASP